MRTHPSSVVSLIQALGAAFQLLTRIPIPLNIPFHETILRRSVVFFPAVGGAIGLLLACAGFLLSPLMPPLASAAVLTALWVALTGGLHLDGLMDTADGIFSGRSRERMLEIMKDSRIGAMGAIACGIQLLLKLAFLASLFPADGGWSWEAGALLAAAPVWSRWFMAIAIASWPYARVGQGLGAMYKGVEPKHLLSGSVLASAISVAVLMLAGASVQAAVVLTAAAALGTGLLGAGMAAWVARKLGGLTGDTYGAMNEGLESLLLLGIVIFVNAFGYGTDL